MKIHRSRLVLTLSAGLCFSAGALAQDVSPSGPAKSRPAQPAPSDAHQLSEAQLAEAQMRAQLANAIVQNVSSDALAKGASEDWRTNLLASLYNTPSHALRNIQTSATTLDEAHAQASAAQNQVAAAKAAAKDAPAQSSSADAVANSLGSDTDNLVFFPMAPCRFIDTRNVGGAIGTTPRRFDTYKTGSTYGGSSACYVVPQPGGGVLLVGGGRPAIAANVTVVNPSTSAGYLIVRPSGSSNTTSWTNWYQTGTVLANAGIITTAKVGSLFTSDAFEMLTGGGSTQVIADFFGYFDAATVPTQQLDCTTTSSGEVFNSNNAGFTATAPSCPSGYAVTGGSCYSSPGGLLGNTRLVSSYKSGNGWACEFYGNTVNNSAYATANCCRVTK